MQERPNKVVAVLELFATVAYIVFFIAFMAIVIGLLAAIGVF